MVVDNATDTELSGATLTCSLEMNVHAIHVLDDINRPNANRLDSFVSQRGIAPLVARLPLTMMRAVNFDCKSKLDAVEIKNIRSARELAAKPPNIYSAIPNHIPESTLRSRHVTPKPPRTIRRLTIPIPETHDQRS